MGFPFEAASVSPWPASSPLPDPALATASELTLVLCAGALVLAAIAVDRFQTRRAAARHAPAGPDAETYRIWNNVAREVVFRVRLTDPLTIERIGPGCFDVLGYTPAAIAADPELARRLALPENFQLTDSDRPDGLTTVVGRWTHDNGRVSWIEHRQRVIRDDRGRPDAIEGSVRDVTETERTRRNLMVALDVEAGTRRRAQRSEALTKRLQDTILLLAHARDEDSVYDGILQTLLSSGEARVCTVWTLDPTRRNLVAMASGGPGHRTPRGSTQALTTATGPAAVVSGGEARWIGNLRWTERDERPALPEIDGLGAWCCVPLHFEGGTLGAISLGYAEPRTFDGDERAFLLTLAGHAETTLERVRLTSEVDASWRALQTLSHKLLAAQESERRTIARELHDVFGAWLSAIRYNLHIIAADESAGRTPPPRHLHESVDLIDRLSKHVRSLSHELRPGLLDERGLIEATRWYARRFAERTHTKVQVYSDAPTARHQSTIETTAFRVIQEALQNIEKHAQAQNVVIDVSQTGVTLRVEIRDDGIGFDPEQAFAQARAGGSLGLLSMRERSDLAGGRLSIESYPGAPETTVVLELPADSPRAQRRTAQA